jgi:hypothetical protein
MNAAGLRRGLRDLIQNTGTDVVLVSRAAGTYSTETGSITRPTPVQTPTRVAVTDFMDEITSGTNTALATRKLLVSAGLCAVTPQKGDHVTGLDGTAIVLRKKDLVMSGVFLGWILYCGGGA